MRFIFFLLAFVGMSGKCYAEWNMNQVDKKYSIVRNQCIVETMPKTRHQGGLPICYAAVAATLLDEFKCYEKDNKIV